jgi:hypothetical protein
MRALLLPSPGPQEAVVFSNPASYLLVPEEEARASSARKAKLSEPARHAAAPPISMLVFHTGLVPELLALGPELTYEISACDEP